MLSYKYGRIGCECDDMGRRWRQPLKKQERGAELKHVSVLQLNLMCGRKFAVTLCNRVDHFMG